jgi:predicted SpoU family rRNA methylase
MGRTITSKHRVEYRDNHLSMKFVSPDGMGVEGKPCHIQAWKGSVSVDRLEDWRKSMNNSFQDGGCNFHLSQSEFGIPHIHYAVIVRQYDRKIICRVTAPAFDVA